MSNLKYKLEALLFSSARSMTLEELSNLTKASPEEIREKINEIKKDYEERDSSITLIDEGNAFKLNIKSEHAPIVQKIVTETELSKTLMETLAIIAFKYPIKQSDLIKIRTNKAYDHLRELEEMGYITRQKYSRTKLIKLTPKFFEYFDLPQDKIKEKFQGFEGIAKAIGEKEQEIKKMKEELKKKAKEAGKKENEQEIDLIDKEGHKQKLDTYEKTEAELEEQEAKEVKPYTDKVGNLEVTDVPEKEESTEEAEEPPEEEPEETTEESETAGGSEVDKRVEELLHPKEEAEEPTTETQEETEAKETQSEEPSKEQKTEGQGKEESKEKPSEETEADKRVEELLHPKETEEEPSEETEAKEKKPESEELQPEKQEKPKETTEEEPKDLLEAAEEEEEKKEEKKSKDENLHS